MALKNNLSQMRSAPILFVAILATVLSGCSEKAPTPQQEAVPGLYSGTIKILHSYNDSLSRANDSATVLRLMDNLLVKLTRLNFELPPNTDLELSEDENDTIYKLTSKIIALRDKRLSSLSRDSLAKRDSVARADSISKTLNK